MKRVTAAITTLGLSLSALPALADTGTQGYGHHMYGGGWGHGLFGPILMIAFLGLTVVLVVLAIRWISGSEILAGGPRPAPRGQTPLDILKERLAKGEIEPQEFEDRRKALGE